MTIDPWLTADGALAVGFPAAGRTLRGLICDTLVHQALTTHLQTLAPSVRVLDVGGGAGAEAIVLARAGHTVTVLDPDPDALALAAVNLAAEDEAVRGRVRLVMGSGEDALKLVVKCPGQDPVKLVDDRGYDLVCCHSVLQHVDDPPGLLQRVVAAARDGGLISVVTRNAAAAPLRPAFEGRYADAVALLDSPPATDLGMRSRGWDVHELTVELATAGAAVVDWRGVRVATDHLGDAPPGPNADHAIAMEWRLGQRNPWRHNAALLHFIARRGARV